MSAPDRAPVAQMSGENLAVCEPASARRVRAAGDAGARHGRGGVEAPAPDFALIELLFFGYREFVADADRRLAREGFGRAHHRVLHFVNREPGLTIAELLRLLRITKQSLNRVLKDLVDGGYVEARAGSADRRERRLRPTAAGRALALDLAGLQTARIGAALEGAAGRGAEATERERARAAVTAFLAALAAPAEGNAVPSDASPPADAS